MTEAPKPQSQPDKFRDLARQIGADEDEKRFEEAVKKVAKAKPPTPKKPG